jgi:uncharacterized protein YndB with AHSA1/START domain
MSETLSKTSFGESAVQTAIEILLYTLGGVAALAVVLAAVGSLRTTHVVTVTRETTASPDAVWRLWADVPQRTRWDEGLEWARIDGPFQVGATGQVKLKGQPKVRFEILECEPSRRYTDRFFLPAGSKMDWQHTIDERSHGPRTVTFRVLVTGPTSLVLTPVMRRILRADLPATVDRLVKLAES